MIGKGRMNRSQILILEYAVGALLIISTPSHEILRIVNQILSRYLVPGLDYLVIQLIG